MLSFIETTQFVVQIQDIYKYGIGAHKTGRN